MYNEWRRQTKEARNAIEAIRVFAMLEKNGKHLPPDLRATHRYYVHRSRVKVELLRFESLPQYASNDERGDYFSASMVGSAVRPP